MEDATQLSGRELDAAVAVEVMRWTLVPIDERDWHSCDYWKSNKREIDAAFWVPSAIPRFALQAEAEIGRRGLIHHYILALMSMVIPLFGADQDTFVGWCFMSGDLFAIRRATPEQICRAALIAVRAAKEQA